MFFSLLIVLLVGGNDLLHECVAHNVRPGQTADGDVVDAVEDAQRLLETGRLVRRQVDLRHVAGDDDVRAEADARQEHLHLLAGGILRLVEDDEAVVERAPAHIRQRRDLDVAALEILGIGVRAEHLKERIVQWAQIGVDLIDCYIYQLNSEQKRYKYLLQLAREYEDNTTA